MTTYSISDETFINAVKEARSIADALSKMGLEPQGGNYATFHRRVKKLGLNTDHFSGQSWSKGNRFGPKRPIKDYLSNSQKTQSYALKKRLISEDLLEAECATCGCSSWFGAPIPLELDHINGNNQDNNLSNLRLLCPNCHAMTDTYKGKNKKRSPKRIPSPKSVCKCGAEKKHRSKICKSCYSKDRQQKDRAKRLSEWHLKNTAPRPERRKAVRPSQEQLLKEIEELGYTGTGRKYGVSDNAVRKWVK